MPVSIKFGDRVATFDQDGWNSDDPELEAILDLVTPQRTGDTPDYDRAALNAVRSHFSGIEVLHVSAPFDLPDGAVP